MTINKASNHDPLTIDDYVYFARLDIFGKVLKICKSLMSRFSTNYGSEFLKQLAIRLTKCG